MWAGKSIKSLLTFPTGTKAKYTIPYVGSVLSLIQLCALCTQYFQLSASWVM